VAISSRGEEKIAKKVAGNGATEEVVVETGISDGRFVEIESGLEEGDKVMGDFSESENGPPGGGGGRRH
jgi:multidrug efflux pump subunit AcrA (membrane-fusion protein)